MKNVALITGASTGIGKELAFIHAKSGADLVLVARSGDKLEELKKQIEADYDVKVVNIVKDLSVVGSATEVYNEVKALGIEVEYLINNAGFGQVGKFEELPWQKHLEMINLNMIALTELSYLFLPDFVKRNSGRILNNSSTAALLPGPLQAVYYASKAYVTSLGNALFEELHDTNVTVTTLMPGATESEFGATSGMNKTKLFKDPATTESVAQDGYSAMMRGDLNIISMSLGQKIMMMMVPFAPKKALLKYVREMQITH
jgi:uncharacterized protein